MRFGTQFLVTMMLIEYLITSIILFLRICYSSFAKRKYRFFLKKERDSTWMSKGVKISINHKRELYLSSRNRKNPKLTLQIAL